MAIIIFFVILSVLVIVHELGHFGVAKAAGIRVDEFGLGYPPRAAKLFSWKGTLFSLNWLPFGGFVKIFGESYAENVTSERDDSFQGKHRGIQAAVLAAGVAMNFLFAWLLLSIGFMTGLPAPAGLDLPITDARTVITQVLPGSPAEKAGLKSGDAIVSLSRGGEKLASEITPEAASSFIREAKAAVSAEVHRGKEVFYAEVAPVSGVWGEEPAIGVAMETVGTVRLGFFRAIAEGWGTTLALVRETAIGLGGFLWQAVAGRADFSGVSGPIGLVGIVGDVSRLGLGHLIAFTALISINLSIINLIPFPALDGGRLLFVAIEAVTRRQIPARAFNMMNAAGFALLILLMVLITVHDVAKIF